MPKPNDNRKMLSEFWIVLISAFRLSAMPGMAGKYMSMASGGRAEMDAMSGSGNLSLSG